MKLVADDKGRLTCAQLFPPRAAFDATKQPDGSVRLVELVEKPVPIVRPRKVGGRLTGASVRLDRNTVAAAVRADREAR